MESNEPLHQMIKSSTGQKEKKGAKNNDKMGWYVFLFFLFLISYAFFAFVYFK